MKKTQIVIFAAIFLALVITIVNFSPVFGDTNQVPNWVRNVIIWWSQGSVSDDEFLKGMKFLVDNNIIQLDSKNPSKPAVTTDKEAYAQGDTITISGTGFAKGDVIVVLGNLAYLQDIDSQAKSLDWNQTDLSEMGILTQYQYSDDNVGSWVKRQYPNGFAISTKVHTDDSGNWQVTLKDYTSTDNGANGNAITSTHSLSSDAYIIKAAQKISDSDGSPGSGYRDLSIKTAYTNISVQ